MKKIIITTLFTAIVLTGNAQDMAEPASKVYQMEQGESVDPVMSEITPQIRKWYDNLANNDWRLTMEQENKNADAAWLQLKKVNVSIGEKGVIRRYVSYLYALGGRDPMYADYQALALYKIREYVLEKNPNFNVPDSRKLWTRIGLTIVNKDWLPEN
ncbi:hypothetical protein KBC03_06290 [Patescibacteria group bacterium]|nr:hypothetical protein [Patescibacteria group bacterium]